MPVPVRRKGLHLILPIVRIPFAYCFEKTISTFHSGGFANLPAFTGRILFPKTLPASCTQLTGCLSKVNAGLCPLSLTTTQFIYSL